MRKHAEEAAKTKAEEEPAEDAQQEEQKKTLAPEGPNPNTRRRQQSRATKRAVKLQRVEDDTNEAVDAKKSQWTKCSDGVPTTSTQWRNWWYSDWRADSQGTFDYSSHAGSTGYTPGAWHSTWS